ncbi:MAG: hypothetical protein V4773_00165 [Verrucomicrobiota bacterium]
MAAFSTASALVALALPSVASAQAKKKNPASKVYVSDVSGEAVIDTGDSIEDLSKRSVYTAQGTVIETKKPENDADRDKYYSTMVYSNGTGAFFDADTRVEVRRFVQEPFTPNRTDVETEPSISQTSAFLSRGAVGLCTSKLVAGSNMNYQTPHGSVNIRGRKIVIETHGELTKISMLEGDSTVRGGPQDLGGHTLHSGEQAIIRPGPPGQPNIVQINAIPQGEVAQLDDKVAMACMAKKTVYFEVRDKKGGSDSADGGTDGAGDGGGDGTGGNGSVTAFDGNSGTSSVTTGREIVPVEVVPTNPPIQHTVSPASVTTNQPTG